MKESELPTVGFRLNGEPVTAPFEEGMTLLDVLRESCGVTSPKDGCSGEGVCGCCVVLVDGVAVLACKRAPDKVHGRDVVTLEGLEERERRILADAFVQEGATQCGFCTPGIAMRAKSLVDRGRAKDQAAIRKALAGHMCRCTGYLRIVDAIEAARDAWDGRPMRGHPARCDYFGTEGRRAVPATGVGAAEQSYRGAEKVLGTKPFVADMKVEGMLHGTVVLSPHPRALVRRIDATAALALPGVHRVVTARDVPARGNRRVGLVVADWPIFVAEGEEARCVGDCLALVVADTQHRARRAAKAVVVECDPLEPVVDPDEALRAGAPRVHEGGNLLETSAYARGDVDAGLRESAHVVRERFETQRIEHAYLEPEAALAVPTADGKGIKLFTQGQGVHDDQKQVASILGIDPALVEVELVPNGGAFGGKEDLSVQGHTALAAFLLGRPVRTVLTREQSLLVHPKRHPMRLEYTVGADASGALLAARVRIVGDTGAYASVGGKVLERAAGHALGPYRVRAVDVLARAVYTNNPPCGAMRGFGVNQASFAIEGILDRLAEKVGIDGVEIRARNILRPGDAFATGQIMQRSVRGLERCLEAVAPFYRGARFAGIACGVKNTGIGNGMDDIGRVLVRVLGGGRIEILTGFTEMGQGLFTILRQVIAEETGLPTDVMDVRARSDLAVLCGMTTASRATALASRAGRIAGRRLAEALRGASLADLAGREFHGEWICDFTTKPGAVADRPVTHMTFSYAAQVVVLDDEGRLDRVIAAHDVGRALNPLQCVGQIEGAVHMGLGQALSESFGCTGGRPDSLRMAHLGMIDARHVPRIDVILVEEEDEVGGYGSKGIGEIGLVPTAGAVAGAIHRFDGQWRSRLPMSESAAAAPFVPKRAR